ncbi:MAG: hypothetical protein RIR91_341 [Verrucomicrobiota bacterium]|jgi:hypothetical protein
MVDEAVRQRIKYLAEHGGVMPQEPPASKRWLCGIGLVIIALQVVEIALEVL